MFHDSSLFIWPTDPPVWLPRLPSQWSGSRTVPTTLVLRFLASAELWRYWTSLPGLIISRTIWSEWTLPRWSPFGLLQDGAWVHSRNLQYPGYSRDPIIAIMELDWDCTDMLTMRHQCWRGLLWIFQKATREPARKTKKPSSELLISHN